jgi:hypothetical protein
MGSPTEFLTLSTSEWPRDAAVCSLSDVLEAGNLPRRYFLSGKACAGIRLRAARRGKPMPRELEAALVAMEKADIGEAELEPEPPEGSPDPQAAEEEGPPPPAN